jgi:uncharacterized repeat protein (TIGR01451 family)
VLLTNLASVTLVNNIILSNGGFGIANNGGGILSLKYNNIYGNANGATWGTVDVSLGNTFGDPMLSTVSGFTITSPSSVAVDSGTTNGLMLIDPAPLQGYARDLGWKESSFSGGIPILHIRKTVNNLVSRPFEELGYLISYSNAGIVPLLNAQIVDVLPSFLLFLTNSAEISNTPHAGSVNVEYSTNYAGSIWQPSTFDSPATANQIKKIRWTLDTGVNPGEKGVVRFKVLVK